MSTTRILLILASTLFVPTPGADAAWDPLQKAERAAQHGSELMAAGDSLGAIQAFLQAQALAPDDARIRMGLAEAFYTNGEFKSAHDQYRATGEADPSWSETARYNAGNAAFSMGEYQKALEHYTQAVIDGSTDPDLLYNLELTQRILEQAESQPSDDQQEQPEQQEGDQQQEEQQQQQQQQQEQEQQEQQPQEPENQEQEGQEDEEQPAEEEEQQQPPTAPPDSNQSPPPALADSTLAELPQGMTPEQAMRLLDALDHDEEELRRSIQRRLRRGSEENDRDW